jgi:hypothetical protein
MKRNIVAAFAVVSYFAVASLWLNSIFATSSSARLAVETIEHIVGMV